MPALKTRITITKARTDTFSVRLPPQTRYLAELAARSQGRSLGNFIQMAVEQVLERTFIDTFANRGQPVPALSLPFINAVWDVDEARRLVKLAISHPELMTFEEQVLYKKINKSYRRKNHFGLQDDLEAFDWKRIDADWIKLKAGDVDATGRTY